MTAFIVFKGIRYYMKKIELLSPAGDYNSFLAAISCGADAVYLSGDKFGARAYAKNFSKEELIKAIDYAHIFSRKVYLTLNTLLKDEEMGEIYDYLLPLYEAGLDAVIVQDMGVISYIRKVFYDMPVHASTQLTITGIEGIRLLENLGVTRTVLARELSMKEIEYIHDNSNMELETFIHGALCYSYSGKCLFSSLAGGRSGNRGRCAGPCRQPYNDEYLLSTKDICSIDYIPSMIKAGICSLKIEGRMKSPEYVGKVTAIYRKYIDYYYDNITKMSVKEISDKFFTGHEFNNDKNILIKLYTRGGNSSGYYYKHNGREMISVSDASYKTEKEENKDIDFTNNIKMPLSAFVRIYPDENISILINNEFYYEGNKALVAKNRPTDSETVLKQLKKTKDTEFEFTDINFDIAKNAFVLLSDLNELRREAINCVRNELTKKYKRKSDFNRNTIVSEMSDESIKDQAFGNNSDLDKDRSISDSKIVINCEITNYEQLKAAASSEYVNGIYIPFILCKDKNIIKSLRESNKKVYVTFQSVCRHNYLNINKEEIVSLFDYIDGVLADSHEVIQFFKDNGFNKEIIGDIHIYTLNKEAENMYYDIGVSKLTVPVELNKKELYKLSLKHSEIIAYGYLPMMVSAQCVNNTCFSCDKVEKTITLKDRRGAKYFAVNSCETCINTIYNNVPLFLKGEQDFLRKLKVNSIRLSFTMESELQIKEIINYFAKCIILGENCDTELLTDMYTKGHLNRGVL